MPARKSEVKVIIEAYGQRFSLNCEEILFDQYRVKNGRSLSKKNPYSTMTEIFEESRKWAVKQRRVQASLLIKERVIV